MMRRVALFAVLMVAPMAGCGDSSSEPRAVFDGTDCIYDGPAEFTLDSEATFAFINQSEQEDVGLAIWKVPEATTTQDIAENRIFGIEGLDPDHDLQVAKFPPTIPHTEYQLTVTPTEPGSYAILCWTGLLEDTADHPADVVTVPAN